MKKIRSRSVVAALLSTAALSAQAQISFGPRVGLNLANVSYTVKTGDAPKTKVRLGAQFGMMLNARFGKLSVQPAVLFSQKGYRFEATDRATYTDTIFSKGTFLEQTTRSTDYKGSIRLNYVEIPLNLIYTTGGNQGFQVLVGPYVGVGLSGKDKQDAGTTKTITTTTLIDAGGSQPRIVESSSSFPARETDVKFERDVKQGAATKYAYYNTPDFGLNLGLGYLKNRVQVQVIYGLGLPNILPQRVGKDPDNTVRNRVLQFTVGYLFGDEDGGE